MTKPPFVIHRDDRPFPDDEEAEYQDWGARLTDRVDTVPWEFALFFVLAIGLLAALVV